VTTKYINQLTVQRNGKSAVATYFLMVMLSTVDANWTANGTTEDYEQSRHAIVPACEYSWSRPAQT
jgi:hypothetical protein